MNKYRKTSLLEVVAITESGDYFVQNEGKPDNRWMIAKEIFESTYVPADPTVQTDIPRRNIALSFGEAIEMLEAGKKVARYGWNGKGMWLSLVTPRDYADYGVTPVLSIHHAAYDYDIAPWIGMKTADNKFVPWLASQADILAKDWSIVPAKDWSIVP